MDDVTYEDCHAKFHEIKIANKEGMALGTFPYKVGGAITKSAAISHSCSVYLMMHAGGYFRRGNGCFRFLSALL